MHHLFAFYTAALADTTTDTALATVQDNVISRPNGRYQMPTDMRALLAYAGGPGATQARIDVPSMRRLFRPHIDPLSVTVLPGDNPPLARWYDRGVDIPETEEFVVNAGQTSGGAAVSVAFVWARPRSQTPSLPPGPVLSMRWTAAITISAGVWAQGQFTFNDNLPRGKYAVVGMSAFGTNLLAARVIFSAGTFRPGCLAQGAQGEAIMDDFRTGRMGEWGRFQAYALPQLECFGAGAGTAQVGYMDLIQVSDIGP